MRPDEVRRVPLEEWLVAVTAAEKEGYSTFDHLCAVDRTAEAQEPGFDVVVRLLRCVDRGEVCAVRLVTRVPQGSTVPTLVGVLPGAGWHEREAAELFGVEFGDSTGAGDRRRVLLPRGFEGHPLRKDFVLAARVSLAQPDGPRLGLPDAQWGPRQP